MLIIRTKKYWEDLKSKENEWVEEKKKEYFKMFGKKIYISIKGKKIYNQDDVIKKWVENKLDEYQINISIFNKRINKADVNTKLFLQEFSNYLYNGGFSFKEYSKLINRDRTTLIYYFNK